MPTSPLLLGGGAVALAGTELAYADNVTGTPTALAAGGPGTAADVPGVAITVPASQYPVWLLYGLGGSQTSTGAGNVLVNIIETTSGSVLLTGGLALLPSANGFFFDFFKAYRLGPVASTRTFKLQAQMYGSVTAQVTNSATYPSLLQACAR